MAPTRTAEHTTFLHFLSFQLSPTHLQRLKLSHCGSDNGKEDGKSVYQCVQSLQAAHSQAERKKVFNTTLARVKTTSDKSFTRLVPGSCSSRSVMFWVRFTVDIFPFSVQDQPALADTTCDGSSSRDRAEEGDALQTSAWWSQEQAGTVQGQAGVGKDGSTPSLTRGKIDFSLCI